MHRLFRVVTCLVGVGVVVAVASPASGARPVRVGVSSQAEMLAEVNAVVRATAARATVLAGSTRISGSPAGDGRLAVKTGSTGGTGGAGETVVRFVLETSEAGMPGARSRTVVTSAGERVAFVADSGSLLLPVSSVLPVLTGLTDVQAEDVSAAVSAALPGQTDPYVAFPAGEVPVEVALLRERVAQRFRPALLPARFSLVDGTAAGGSVTMERGEAGRVTYVLTSRPSRTTVDGEPVVSRSDVLVVDPSGFVVDYRIRFDRVTVSRVRMSDRPVTVVVPEAVLSTSLPLVAASWLS